ncbi:MAG TPA: cupredoxin domain-containing protein [Bacillota bacterium]
MRRSTQLVVLVAALSALMLVLAACGGGGGNEGSSSTGGGDGGLVVELGPGFAFSPNEISVSAGEEVTIQLVNKDSTVHNFSIEALNVHSGEVAAGETKEITFTAPSEPGEYEILCDIPGHAAGGMVATLVVN